MFKRSTRLLASAAASAGLAFAGLSVAAPAAEAATPSKTATAFYTCTNPLGLPAQSFKVPAKLSLDTLDDALLANVPIPAGTPFTTELDFSAAGLIPSLLTLLQGVLNTVVGQIPTVGPQISGPLDLLFTQLKGATATLTGQLGTIVPTGGALPIPVPTEFSFGTLIPILAPLGIKCTLDAGSVVQPGPNGAGIPVIAAKFGSKVKAKARNKAGHKAVVTVKVKTSAGAKALGTVVAKTKGIKAKSKALKNGKVKFVFKNLKLGKHKIKVRFLGNGFTAPSKKRTAVRISR